MDQASFDHSPLVDFDTGIGDVANDACLGLHFQGLVNINRAADGAVEDEV